MFDFNQRFGGVERSYGKRGFAVIQQAHIGIVGLGGVGSWVAEALARSGVGQLTLIDMDDVSESNINRQILALSDTLNLAKVQVMQARIEQINPACQCHAVEDFIGTHNVASYLAQDGSGRAYDYIVDACDSVRAKAAIINWCKRNRQSVITIGGAGGQLDPTLIQLADLSRAYSDPLLAKVRASLVRHYGFKSVRPHATKPQADQPQGHTHKKWGVECVFSSEQLKYPQADGEVGYQKNQLGQRVDMDCSQGLGALSFVTGTFAFVASARVLQKLVKAGLKNN